MRFLKRIITVFAVLAMVLPAAAQDTVLTESFENGGLHPTDWISSSESGNPGRNWGISNRFQTEGLYSDTAKPYQSDTLYLTSPIFDCSIYTFVTLEFDHICDISAADSGRIQVRKINNGVGTWETISIESLYEGPTVANGGALWVNNRQAFNSASYLDPWAGLCAPCAPFGNAWWKRDVFNISTLALEDSCQIRFMLKNGGSVVPSTENGWFLDNINVLADVCETIKPLGNFDPPFIANKSIQFSLGPYQITGTFTDKHSGVDTGFVYFKVNNAPTFDSIPMVKTATPDQWRGTIPKLYNGVDTFKVGDSVCYYVKVFDKSVPCANFVRMPDPSLPGVDSCNKFYISNGEPLPFCDDFDVLNLWTDSASPATPLWELGDPSVAGGGGYPPFSSPNSWITREIGDYPDNVVSYLYSPILDFGNAKTPRLTFMQNRQMVADGDNFSLEYSINGGAWTTLGVSNDPAGVSLSEPNCPSTWYTATGSSSVANSWNGLSAGWEQSFYQLPITFNSVGSVQFRFKFESDGGGTDYGVAIDDFCIANPADFDLSAIEVIAPGSYLVDHDHFIRTASDTDSVIVVLRNLGTEPLFSIPVEYRLDSTGGSATFSETFTYPRTWNGITKDSLLPLESDTFLFTTRYVVPQGAYHITAYPQLTGDADASNDTVVTGGHFGFTTDTITYSTDFENSVPLWATLPFPVGECGNPPDFGGTRWEKGMPNWNVTNSTRSGVNAWDINLDSGYTVGQEEVLYTQFFDLSNWDEAFLSFWQNRNTDIANDGFRVEYRVYPSKTWLWLESFTGTPDEINWYSGAGIVNGDGWSGNSNGWVYSEFPFTSLPGGGGALLPKAGADKVQFRFKFISDNAGSTVEDGVSIDDFRIVNPPLYDVEVVDFHRPIRGCVMDIEEDVEIEVKNVGKVPIDSIVVCYEYGLTPVTPPLSGPFCDTIAMTTPLPVGNTIRHTFSDFADMQTFGIYTFNGYTSHKLDTNYTNDSIWDYTAENVEGCEMGVTLTTSGNIPLGSYMYVIDTTNLPHDTIYSEPFSNIGPNAVQVYREICMENVGDFKFVITPNAAGFITYWNLQDLFADTSMGTGSAPTGPAGYGFHWQCPPLLSASSQNLKVIGAVANLPIPQLYTFKGTMKNQGSINIRSYEFSINIDKTFPTPALGVLTHKDTIVITFPPKGVQTLQTQEHTFNTSWTGEPGTYEICIWTSQPNDNPDLYTLDDTTCITFTVLDTVNTLATPYCNNFDGTMNPWAALSKNSYSVRNSFEKGVPAQAPLNVAPSTPNVWMTGLSTNYVVLDSSSIVSPLFAVDDTSACYQISFTHQFKTEYAFDGATVEYSIDSGNTWITVGAIDDTIYTMSNANWYNTPYVVGLSGSPNPPGWTGNSNGVLASSYDLKFPDFGLLNYHVVFRLRFGGDGSINDVGWLIDDFCFQKSGVCIYTTCFDEIQNQGEDDVDCGGPCPACESCFDGILNQNETDIDCGGVCAPCPSCVDGIQNGNETSIDCGGPDCAPCGTCSDGIRNFQWVEDPVGSGIYVQVWEDVFGDCGGPCPPCWVGVEELDENKFTLGQNIPNPTEGRTIINYSIPNGGTVNVTVRNLLGQSMYETTLQATKGINRLEIDVNDWADGVYYYAFEFNGERLIKKMTVNK